MNEHVKTGPGFTTGIFILTAICLSSGLGVGLLYAALKDDILRKEESVFDQSLRAVLGEAESYPTVGEYGEDVKPQERVYMNQTDEGVLYAALGAARGYQSEIRVLVSVLAEAPNEPVGENPEIYRLVVVSSGETPGLGENIKAVEQDVSVWSALIGTRSAPRRPWFQEQFSRKRLSDLVVEKRQDTRKIAAITGATITSRATVEAARNAVEAIIRRTSEVYGK